MESRGPSLIKLTWILLITEVHVLHKTQWHPPKEFTISFCHLKCFYISEFHWHDLNELLHDSIIQSLICVWEWRTCSHLLTLPLGALVPPLVCHMLTKGPQWAKPKAHWSKLCGRFLGFMKFYKCAVQFYVWRRHRDAQMWKQHLARWVGPVGKILIQTNVAYSHRNLWKW